MIKKIILLSTLIFMLSCVPSKDLTYLQGNPVAQKDIDRINNVPYKIQVDDLIHIEIQSTKNELIDISMFQKGGGTNINSNTNTNSQNFGGGSGYFTDYSVDNHGNIRLPYIGDINVLGYTTVQVRKKLEEKFWKWFKNKDDVFITVKLSGIKYTIIGEVNSPGPKVIFQNKVSIIDAIANSGDITTVGNRKKVEIIRHSITGSEKFIVDLTDINIFNSNVFYIKPNDIINVIPLKQKAWGVGTTGLQTLTTVISVFTLLTSTYFLVSNL
jgi:polysaccharide export outer membrane protein